MKQPRKPIEALTPSPQPTARRLIPAPSSPLSLEDVDWSSISCSEQDTCRMSHSPLSSECSQGDDAGYIKLPSPDCNLGRPLVYLGSFLGLLCAVGGVATATFVLSGGPHVGAAIDEAAGFDRADSDMGIEPVAAPRITAGPSRMLSTKPASLDDYDEAGMNVAYIDKTVEENKLKLWSQNDEEDLPSAYEMRKYADELMRHSNEFAKFRTNQTTAPQTVSVTRPAKKQGAAKGRNLPIWRDQPATTVPATHTTDCRSTVLPPSQAPLSSGEGSARPLPTGNDKMASSSTATQSEGRVKSIESGGMSSDVDSDVTPSGRIAPAATRGLLAALPLPTKAHGPGPRSLICLVEGGGVRPGPPLHECSHLILGNQVLDLVQRVIRPARRGSSDREPLGMTTAAMAEQVRALRAESAPGIRILAGLRSMEVENTYVHLWSNQSGLAASANLAYEWVRRAGLDGIALTNVVLGRHTVDVYEGFLKRLRALFREDYLIVFGFFHRESHEHDHVYTENAIRTIVRLCSFTVFEAHDVRPRSCRSFVLNALNDYRNAISNATIVSSLATIRSLGVPLDQTCVSMSLAVMRFLLYDRPRRLGQVCHNYFAEAYSMHCREWTEIRYERGAVSNTALVHRRATAAAEIMDSFDNETTLTHKVKALVRNTGIPCVAVYNVELDDATGVCESETPYSRLTAVATALRGTTLTKRTTAAPPKLKPRKAIAGDHSTAEPSPATAAPHPRHRVRKRVVVAVKKRRHQQAS